MGLMIVDSASRKKVRFEPIDSNHVRLYVCGPTVYDRAHIGNARPVVVFDILFRLLQTQYPRVTYCRNITDLDDKINQRAKESGVPIDVITMETIKYYHDDMAALGALEPTMEPRATGHIQEMIDMISVLIDRGHAYAAAGHVLFHVASWPEYGDFANRSPKELLAGARVEIAPFKRDPGDFVLWKPSSDDLPGWHSPWGRGRPGWHIECSAMARKHLGDSFDIHGGGADLKFPHHQNEIAQSECCTGKSYAKYWMHNGFVMVNGEKMSKSLGNFRTVEDLLKDWPGEAIRLALMSSHYRAPLDISEERLRQARNLLDNFYRVLEDGGVCNDVTAPPAVLEALNDDLNTAGALAALNALKDDPSALKAGAKLLGLLQQDPNDWFRNTASAGMSAAAIDALIKERSKAKLAKDFARSDEIRHMLNAANILIEDGPSVTTWRYK